MARSWLLWALWQLGGQPGPAWLSLVPWVQWLWHYAGLLWPWLRRQPEWCALGWLLWQAQRGLLIGCLGLTLGTLPPIAPPALVGLEVSPHPWILGMGCLVCRREEPRVEVVQEQDGSYTAPICGHFTLQVARDHPFRARLLLLFPRLLEAPGQERGSRRTCDGRTPFVCQQYLAQRFGMPQPDII